MPDIYIERSMFLKNPAYNLSQTKDLYDLYFTILY